VKEDERERARERERERETGFISSVTWVRGLVSRTS
jgi:hypothetical protein